MKFIIGVVAGIVLFGAVPSLGYWAYDKILDYQAQIEEYAANAEVLASSYYAARNDAGEAQAMVRQLESNLHELTAEYNDLLAEHGRALDELAEQRELKGSLSNIAELEAKKAQLITEIYDYSQQRQVLIPQISPIPIPVLCTGSMKPTINCLDTLSVMMNPLPMDIHLGSIVVYDPVNLNCGMPPNILVMHRVVDVRGTGTDKRIMAQGDNNSAVDGCWVPMSAIHYYVVSVQKSDHPEGMALLSRITAIEKDATAMLGKLDEDLAEIDKIRAGLAVCQPVWGRDVCPVGHVNSLISKYNHDLDRYTAKLDQAERLRNELQVISDAMWQDRH